MKMKNGFQAPGVSDESLVKRVGLWCRFEGACSLLHGVQTKLEPLFLGIWHTNNSQKQIRNEEVWWPLKVKGVKNSKKKKKKLLNQHYKGWFLNN